MLFGSGIIARMSTDADSASLVETWRGVALCHAKVSGALDKALEREHGIGLSEFEVLERLATTDALGGWCGAVGSPWR